MYGWAPPASRTSTTRGGSHGRRSRCSRRPAIDRSYWGPEIEFFVFDSVQLVPSYAGVRDAWAGAGYLIGQSEAPWDPASGQPTIRFKEGYRRTPPTDSLVGLRAEMCNILADDFHIVMDAHHHEVATASQSELNVRFDELVPMADHIQDVRYVIKNVARRHGKVACLMPKPIYGDNGIGMHTNQSLWTKGKNVFYDPDDEYAEVSQASRYYIGGLLEHARALCAITNPITNSYRRLVPGYEAPVFIAWSKANRSANVRIPFYHRGRAAAKRIEYRTPDSAANIYLTEAALAMAGLDGIRRKIEPPPPVDENIYKLSPAKRKQLRIRELPGSLSESLDCLASDRDFLKPAFAGSLIDTYIEMKREEQLELNLRPHPYRVLPVLRRLRPDGGSPTGFTRPSSGEGPVTEASLWSGGRVFTGRRYVEAVLVENGRVLFAGALGGARRLAPTGVERRALGGSLLIPGLVDAHVHLSDLTRVPGRV